MPKIMLQNCTKQPYELNEYHQLVCARRETCTCAIQRGVGAGGKPVVTYLPRSHRIAGGKTSEPLDAEILFVPYVANLVRTGALKRIDVKEE